MAANSQAVPSSVLHEVFFDGFSSELPKIAPISSATSEQYADAQINLQIAQVEAYLAAEESELDYDGKTDRAVKTAIDVLYIIGPAGGISPMAGIGLLEYAARRDSAVANAKLASFYMEGKFVLQNIGLAIKHYKKAADLGNPESCYVYGQILMGEAQATNDKKLGAMAQNYLQQAKDAGYTPLSPASREQRLGQLGPRPHNRRHVKNTL